MSSSVEPNVRENGLRTVTVEGAVNVGIKQFADYDSEADVLYVTLLDEEVSDSVELDDTRMVDYTEDGRVVGVEFVSPSAGIDLHDVPNADTVEKVIGLSGLQFKIVA